MASKLNIKEANEHLQKLHHRVYELENQLQLQAIHVDELQRANGELEQRVRDVLQEKEGALKAKDSQIAKLSERLEESERHVQALLTSAEDRDATVMKLETKARLFYEMVEHRSSLARILDVLDELGGGGGEGGSRGDQPHVDSSPVPTVSNPLVVQNGSPNMGTGTRSHDSSSVATDNQELKSDNSRHSTEHNDSQTEQ